MLAAQPYDILLSDLRMADGDGPDLYDWVMREQPAIARRLAFITGDTLGASAARFLERSARPVLEKPFTPATVRRLVAALSAS
jgi:CheY-like chemotaxis protein